MRIGPRVVVEIGQMSPVAAARPVLRALLSPRFSVRSCEGRTPALSPRWCRPTVVDDDHVIVGVLELLRPSQQSRIVRSPLKLQTTTEIGGQGRSSGTARRQRPHGPTRARLSAALPSREAEGPIIDVIAPAMPFVGPGEDEGTGAADGKRGAELGAERVGSLLLVMSMAIQADLAQHERSITGQVVKSRQVRL